VVMMEPQVREQDPGWDWRPAEFPHCLGLLTERSRHAPRQRGIQVLVIDRDRVTVPCVEQRWYARGPVEERSSALADTYE
jgi:hypothetical protein